VLYRCAAGNPKDARRRHGELLQRRDVPQLPGFFEEGDNLMHDALGANYERPVEIKYEYGPTNLFRLNQNIKPTVS
jgi:hypothetical protein